MNSDKPTLLQQKLHGRTIEPSANAWAKLDAKLHTEKKIVVPIVKKRNYLAIAASVIAVLGAGVIAYILFNDNNNKASVISTANNQTIIENLSPDVSEKNNKENTMAITSTAEQTTSVKQNTQKSGADKITPNTRTVQVSENNRVKNDTFTNQTITGNDKPVIVQQNNDPISNADEETDKLLNSAMDDLQKKKYRNVLTQAKASVLLDEVETDIKNNKSLRSKIYNEVDKKYNQIKTVIVDK